MKASKKEQVTGSKKNKPGSATASKSSSIKFSAQTEKTLAGKMKAHNEKAPDGRRTTTAQLKAVYRRGAGAFSSSHRPGMSRDQWAMARVNAYLKLLKSGKPSNSNYTQDNDLLPTGHPKSTRGVNSAPVTAALRPIDTTDASPELMLFAISESIGEGYEMITPLRAAWMRAVRDEEENPLARVHELATLMYVSRDADLLPRKVVDSE